MVSIDRDEIKWISLSDSFLYSPREPEAHFEHNDPTKHIGDHMLLNKQRRREYAKRHDDRGDPVGAV